MGTKTMYDGSVIGARGQRLYLATFKFLSIEYTHIFYKAFYAKDSEDLENKIHEYLINNYDIKHITEKDGNVYYHFDDEVAIKYCGWENIKSLKQLTSKLL